MKNKAVYIYLIEMILKRETDVTGVSEQEVPPALGMALFDSWRNFKPFQRPLLESARNQS